MALRFTGSSFRSLDAKGRLVLPPKFLEALGAPQGNGVVPPGACDAAGAGPCAVTAQAGSGSFWLTAFNGHLTAYRPEQWDAIVEKLSAISMPPPSLAHFMTKIIGLAQELTPDAQGRVRIPQPLMREAGLSRDAVLVGMVHKFEIWDQGRFDALNVESTENVIGELAARNVELAL